MTPRVSVGDRVPQAMLGRMIDGAMYTVELHELIAGRRAVIAGRLLRVTGRIERDGPITHLIAEQVEDISPLLSSLGRSHLIDPTEGRADETRRAVAPRKYHPREQAKALFPSRDFH